MARPSATPARLRLPSGGAVGRGLALVLAVALLLLGDLAAPTAGTPLSRSVSLAALPLVLPVARYAVRPHPGSGGLLALAGGLLAGPVRSLFYDPLRDADCRGCFRGAFAVLPDIAVADSLALIGNVMVVAGLTLAIPWRRLTLAPVAMAGVGVAAVFTGPLASALAGVGIAAASLASHLLTQVWSRRQLARLVTGLQKAVDLDLVGIEELEQDLVRRHTLTPQVRLGLEQARLRVRLADRASEIAESRQRIVARADEEARRLERDLHDGAQQHLLGLGMALLDAPQTPRIARALEETRGCIDDLRRVARGIYPPVLESAGLRPALVALAQGAFRELDVPDGRLPPLVERTAFHVVADALRRSPPPHVVHARLDAGVFTVSLDAPPPPREAVVNDRVAALGGTIASEEDLTVVRLPCA